MLMESDLMDLRAVEEDLSDMDDDDLTRWALPALSTLLTLSCCFRLHTERSRQDPRAWPAAHRRGIAWTFLSLRSSRRSKGSDSMIRSARLGQA